ncbi:MAG: hypothetical protein MRY49_03460 [Candidatus Pacebacteria bacterium]|nr:hypothetical protein [Candidatus Paceibacterota bacterium]
MSPEEKELLELARENNRLLKKIKRHMAMGTIFRFIYWAIIIGAGIGIFYFLQPYIDSVIGTYTDLTGKVDQVNSLFGN